MSESKVPDDSPETFDSLVERLTEIAASVRLAVDQANAVRSAMICRKHAGQLSVDEMLELPAGFTNLTVNEQEVFIDLLIRMSYAGFYRILSDASASLTDLTLDFGPDGKRLVNVIQSSEKSQ